MNSHCVHTKYLVHFEEEPQTVFVQSCTHTVAEDYRGYQALYAAIILRLLQTDWLPDITDLPDPESRARAGYLLEYAARKISNDRTKKLKLFSLASTLRPGQSAQKLSLFPNIPQTPAPDGLCKEWGITDGLCRSNILKMIAS